nr:7753_t:CDS:2 [Entrophospora candida]
MSGTTSPISSIYSNSNSNSSNSKFKTSNGSYGNNNNNFNVSWYRSHGYHPPFDFWLIMHWIIMITLIIGYFEFSLKFVSLTDTSDFKVIKEGRGRDLSYPGTKGAPIVVDVHKIFSSTNSNIVIFGLFVNILLIFLSSVVALFVGYLLFFHLRLYLMDMSTVEYLSHRQQIGYYTNVHYEDEYDENPWRRPYYSNPWHRRLMCWAKEFRKKDKLSSSWDSTHHNRFDVYNV